jgi:oligopeptide transport system substrate-binding protein
MTQTFQLFGEGRVMKKSSLAGLILMIGAGVFARGAAEEPPVEKTHLIVGVDGIPEQMPPRSELASGIALNIFEGLVSWHPRTLEPIPGVAESWEISADGLTYTFKLRKDAAWSDGTPVTADQFREAWLHLLDPETRGYGMEEFSLFVFKGAEEYRAGRAGPEAVAIRAPDERTLQFELVYPLPYALFMLGWQGFQPLPTHVIAEHGERWTDPDSMVGNGPFVIEQWLPGDRAVFRKNDRYWDKESVKLDRVTLLEIADADTAHAMFQAGEIDLSEMIPYDRLAGLLRAPHIQLTRWFATDYYICNMKRSPLDDVRVRKALAVAINRAELIDKALDGLAYPAFGLSPPMPFYPEVIGFEENADRARSLLAEAGYPGGEGFPELTLIYNKGGSRHERIAEQAVRQWADKLGIVVSPKGLPWDEYMQALETSDFDLARHGWWGHYMDPNCFLELYTGGSIRNPAGFENPVYDGLLARASRMPAGEERLVLLREAEELLIRDEMVLMPLYGRMRGTCIDTEVWGGWYGNILYIHPWKYIYRK